MGTHEGADPLPLSPSIGRAGNIVVDLDGTLCKEPDIAAAGGDPQKIERAYREAAPFLERIAQLRDHRARGSRIVIWTARWASDRKVTEEWLRANNVPCDELLMGKPRADVYVDDRAWRPDEFFGETEHE